MFRLAFLVRKRIERSIRQHFPLKEARLFQGLFLGHRSEVPEETQEQFIRSGVVHILAVSGLHVGLVLVIFYLFFRSLGLDRKRTSVACIFFIIFYALVTGARPSALRASIMLATCLTALFLDRDPHLFNSLSFAGILLLLAEPLLLWDIGFQLSFLATWGILYMFSVIEKRVIWNRWKGVMNWILIPLLVSLGAQLGSYPILAYHFHRISLVAPLTNLLVVPVVGMNIAIGFLMFIADLASPFLASIFASANWFLLNTLESLMTFFSSLPFSARYFPRPPLAYIVGYYIFLSLVPLSLQKRRVRWFLVFLILTASLSLGVGRLLPDKLEITFLSVGQGDAIHIRLPSRKNILIDAGGAISGEDTGKQIVSPYLFYRGVWKLESIFLTHPGYNHCAGLISVIKRFGVKRIYFNGKGTGKYWDELSKLAREKGIGVESIGYGRRLKYGNVVIDVWNPQETLNRNQDNSSLVLRVQYKNFSCLLTSEIGLPVQEMLARERIASSVLQIPAHGDSSLSPLFIESVSPEVAIVSGSSMEGKNKDLMQSENIKVFLTGRDGAVTVISNGADYTVKKFLK